MTKLFLITGIGGALGTCLRYYTSLLFLRWNYTAFPYATLTVNVLGCFIIGLLFSVLERYNSLSSDWRLFLITGFCGGFTTFSTFAYENILLLEQGDYKYFFIYAFGSYAAGLLAVLAGINILKLV